MKLNEVRLPDIKKWANTGPHQKARQLIQSVKNPTRSGGILRAQVQGSRLYSVQIASSDGPELQAVCSCPYDWGGLCKHCGAVLMLWVQSPHLFKVVIDTDAAGASNPLRTLPVPPLAKTKPPKESHPLLTYSVAIGVEERLTDFKDMLGDTMRVQDLRALAKRRGWLVKGTNKNAIIEQIAERLLDPDEMQRYVDQLNEEQLHVLNALQIAGETDWIGEDNIRLLVQSGASVRRKAQIAHVRGLKNDGIMHETAYHSADREYIPIIIGRLLPPSPSNDTVSTLNDEWHITTSSPATIPQTVAQLLRLIEHQPVDRRPQLPRLELENYYLFLREWTYDNNEIAAIYRKQQLDDPPPLIVPPAVPQLPDAAVAQYAPLVGGDPHALDFIVYLLRTLTLFQDGTPLTVWSQAADNYLTLPPPHQQKILACAYFSLFAPWDIWYMVQQSPDIQLKRYVGSLQPAGYRISWSDFCNQAHSIRDTVLRLLSLHQEGVWHDLDSLIEQFHAVLPEISDYGIDHQSWLYGRNKMQDTPRWFVTTGGKKPDDTRAHRQFLLGILQGALSWLGLVDVATHPSGTVRFRLHGLADLYWDRVDALSVDGHQLPITNTAAQTAIDITVDGTKLIVDPMQLSAEATQCVSAIAEIIDAQPGKFTYQLTIQTVHRTFENGLSAETLCHQWEAAWGVPMPPTFADLLQTWWADYGTVRLYDDVTVIEFGDAYALEEMKLNTSLTDVMIGELSPTLIIIPHHAIDKLKTELEKAGYTPKVADKV